MMESSDEFDKIIGCIEDILVDGHFQAKINDFMEKYWEVFEDTEENKLEYTEIFSEYTIMVEDYITTYLTKEVPNFSKLSFFLELQKRKDNLDGEVFDILLTMSDFIKFKETILDFRSVKEGSMADLYLDSCTKIQTSSKIL